MSEKEILDETINEEEKNEEAESKELSPEEECRAALENAQAEVTEYKDKYLRAHADFENSKKRLEKEKATAVAYSVERFATDLLSVIDSFESAQTSIDQIEMDDAHEAVAKIEEGMKLTYEQFLKVLERHGITEVDCAGEFDPEYHQAIMQVESDEHESGQIVQVMQKGYTMKERVIRPAMVSTSK